MPSENRKPVILLAFANDAAKPLRSLADEFDSLRKVLEKVEDWFDVQPLPYARVSQILDFLQDERYRDRLAIFHYAGHANGTRLLLESTEGKTRPAYAGGLAAMLRKQRELRLVFLNGCSTQEHARELLQGQVSAVIATSKEIHGYVATEFATRFYKGLVEGANLRSAYEEAVDSVRTNFGDNALNYYHKDSTGDNRWRWDLHLNESVSAADRWTLAQAASDPLFGVRKLPEGDLPPKPYQHLYRFTRKQAEVFFGRGRQIRELYDLVTAPSSAPIILLYGQSGVGKSSLLEAGLQPYLEQDFVIRYCRRKQEIGLEETLHEALQEIETKSPLKSAWIELEKAQGKPVVVILDQAEEVYTRPNPDLPDELQMFLEALKATFADSAQRPNGKLILGFRKEWLAEIEKRLNENELFPKKVFLERLDRDGIIEAITGPARVPRLQQHYGLRIADGLAEIIADDLLADRDSPIATTLQILLTKMWDEATQQNRSQPHFDYELYNHLKKQGILLQDFLNQQLDALRTWQPEVVDSGLALDVLAFHTTPLGSAEQRSAEELAQEYRHRQDVLPAFVQKSKDLYLLVDPAADQPEEALTTATRLTHDTLAPLVRRQFDESDKPGQRAQRILENRSVEWRDGQQGTPLDERDLAVVERGKDGMRVWNADEERLIEASRKKRTKNQRTRKTMRRAGVVAVLAIVITAGVAWWQRNNVIARSYAANYNLAKVFEGKAQEALKSAEKEKRLSDYQKAWLYSLAALNQNFHPDSLLPVSMSNLLQPELQNVAFAKIWIAPDFDIGNVLSVAFSPDGKLLASGSWDKTVRLWDVATGKEVRKLVGNVSIILTVAFSPDGKLLASGSRDKTIRLWEVGSGKEIIKLEGHEDAILSVAFSPNGKLLASGSSDKTIQLWDVTSGKKVSKLAGHEGDVLSVAFSPDRRLLASGSLDNTIRLWEVTSGKKLSKLEGHEWVVTSVVFSPDGKLLASGSKDRTIRLWEVVSSEQVSELEGHEDTIRSVAFSPDSKLLASGSDDKTIRMWEVASGEQVSELEGHEDPIRSVAFSPDSKLLASASEDKTIRLWEVVKGHEVYKLSGHESDVLSVAFSPDGKLLASGSVDKTIRLWEVVKGHEVYKLSGHEGDVLSVAFSPDGKLLASGSVDETIRLWELPRSQEASRLAGHPKDYVLSVAFSPDGKLLASGTGDKTIRLWELTSGEEVSRLAGHEDYVMSVAFSPDGKLLASGSRDHTIRLWEVTSGKEVQKLEGHKQAVLSVAFSPDGKLLASGSGDNSIRLWEVVSGKELNKLSGHTDAVMSVAFSPDGKLLASGSGDNSIRLWEVVSGKELNKLSGHKGDVPSVAFSPDGKLLASGSGDNTIWLWDLRLLDYDFKRDHRFYEACKFVLGWELEGLELKPIERQLTLKAQDGYNFVYPQEFRPLLNPRPPGKNPVAWILENLQ